MGHYSSHPLSTPRSAHTFLDQEKIWVNRELESVRIKEMDSDYLLSAMTWLLKRSEELKFAMEMYYTAGVPEADSTVGSTLDAEFTRFLAMDAKTWMKGTKLFQRMMRRYRKSAAFGQPKIKLPLLDVVNGSGY